MSEAHWQSADKALRVLPVPTAPRKPKRAPDKATTYLKEYSREGRTFRKLLRTSCFLHDPIAKILYPDFKRKHRHHKGESCQEFELIPNCPISVPTCCDQHRTEVREIVRHHHRLLYNSPRPRPPDPSRLPDQLERAVSRVAHDGKEHRSLPLSTVSVRWHEPTSKTSVAAGPLYDETCLKTLLSAFGPVRSVTMAGPTSALVVYDMLADSCKAVEEPVQHYWFGAEKYQLHCSWFHRSLEARAFYRGGGKVRAITNEFM